MSGGARSLLRTYDFVKNKLGGTSQLGYADKLFTIYLKTECENTGGSGTDQLMSESTEITGQKIIDDPVPKSVFSVDHVADKEKYDAWRESIACIFDVDADKDVRSQDFSCSVSANMFGPVMLARTETLEQTWERSSLTIARDGMDHYMIQLYDKGSMQFDSGAGVTDFPVDGLVVFDLSRKLTCETNNFSNISLIVPREMMEDTLKSQEDQHARVLTSAEPMVALLRDHMLSLERQANCMTATQAREIAPATIGLATACLNASVSKNPAQQSGVSLALLTIAKRLIEENLSQPTLTPEWAAGQLGVSRSKLYKLFDTYGGVASYIRERRLRRALLALSDPNLQHRPISHIAMESGFSSDSVFSRVFRSRFGRNPRAIRQHGLNDLHSSKDSAYSLDRRYETWLHHLSL